MLFNKLVSVLDFGTDKLSIAVNKINKKHESTIIAMGTVKYPGYYQQEFLNDFKELFSNVKSLIINAQCQAKTRLKEIYIGVPSSFIIPIVECVEVNFGVKKTIGESDLMLAYNSIKKTDGSENFVLFQKILKQCSIDGVDCINPIGQTATKLECYFLLLYTYPDFINMVNKILTALNIRNKGFYSSQLAEYNYLFNKIERKNVPILLDMGASICDITIIGNNDNIQIDSYCDGGAYLSNDLSEAFGISMEQADELKTKINLNLNCSEYDYYEIDVHKIPCVEANKIVTERLNILIDNLIHSIESIASELTEQTELMLSGGGLVYFKGIEKYLSENLGGLKVNSVNNKGVKLYKAEDMALYSLVYKLTEKNIDGNNTIIEINT
jgi:Actin-like ATPase involved in cell division